MHRVSCLLLRGAGVPVHCDHLPVLLWQDTARSGMSQPNAHLVWPAPRIRSSMIVIASPPREFSRPGLMPWHLIKKQLRLR
eukprot:757735-Rhodomonas_salina.2